MRLRDQLLEMKEQAIVEKAQRKEWEKAEEALMEAWAARKVKQTQIKKELEEKWFK